MSNRDAFRACVADAVNGIRTEGRMVIQEAPRQNADRVMKLDWWRAPNVVSEYSEVDFADELEPAILSKLSLLIEQFKAVTSMFNPAGAVPDHEGRAADELLLQIDSIINAQK
jgi:hypothetical protein